MLQERILLMECYNLLSVSLSQKDFLEARKCLWYVFAYRPYASGVEDLETLAPASEQKGRP